MPSALVTKAVDHQFHEWLRCTDIKTGRDIPAAGVRGADGQLPTGGKGQLGSIFYVN